MSKAHVNARNASLSAPLIEPKLLVLNVPIATTFAVSSLHIDVAAGCVRIVIVGHIKRGYIHLISQVDLAFLQAVPFF